MKYWHLIQQYLIMNSQSITQSQSSGWSRVMGPNYPSLNLPTTQSQSASQSWILYLFLILKKKSQKPSGCSIRRLFQYLLLFSFSRISTKYSNKRVLSTMFSFITPTSASFRPSSVGMTLGTETPGVSIKYMRGFDIILNPLVPFVVQTDAVTLLADDLFSISEILRSWLRIEDLPTLGMPQTIIQQPTCLYLPRYLSRIMVTILRMSSCLCEETPKQVIPRSLQSLMTLLVFKGSQTSILLKMITLSFLPDLTRESNSELRLEYGSRASRISTSTSALEQFYCITRRAFRMWPGNQFILSPTLLTTDFIIVPIYCNSFPQDHEHPQINITHEISLKRQMINYPDTHL